MDKQRRNSPGFSLVEMVIVISVIALMTAIAVPTLAHMGLFANNASRETARDLYTLMTAAQVYSETYHVDAAVAYTVNTRKDSVTGANVQIIDGMAEVRRLRSDEYIALLLALTRTWGANSPPVEAFQKDPDDNYPFVPIRADNGRFQLFNRDAAVELTSPVPPGEAGAGFKAIRIYDSRLSSGTTGFLVEPRPGEQYENVSDVVSNPVNYCFPAHIFKANGTIEGSPARMKVYVTVAPDALPQMRFANQSTTPPTPVAPYIIELYPTMGRLKISFGETT